MKSVMSHSFSQVPRAEIQRSQFNRSSGYKTTFDSGKLIPVFWDEVLPGDTFNLRMSTFARLATPIVPVMDNMFVDSFFFFVPNRLIWDNWQKFNGEQRNPGDSTDFLTPQMVSPASTGYTYASISDYLGLPTGIPGYTHSSFYHRAYNLIWNEWFRDQNLQNSVVVDVDDGPDSPSDYVILNRGKRHDYFTSCLPWPQKGPAVNIPLGSSAPILGDGSIVQYESTGVPGSRNLAANATNGMYLGGAAYTVDQQLKFGANTGLTADLSEATAATINALRQAFQLQRLYERDARGGTRYTEIIRAHFNVTSPDARLQRPEYLGGGSTPINIHPVTQTSSSDGDTPQGNMAGFGTFSSNGQGFTKSFTEHGVILGMLSVRADLNYQQGLNRAFSRRTRWDYYWPALAHIGEQAVLNKEIYTQGTADPTADEAVFGYQERFAEYRYKPSLVTGKFRSNDAQSLDIWHLAQDFGSLPVLNDQFIREAPPINRIVAVPSEPQFLLDAYFSLKTARPMPTFSVPGLIDHF